MPRLRLQHPPFVVVWLDAWLVSPNDDARRADNTPETCANWG